MKVAVIGAGIVGANAAWRLARRGHQVTLYEQHEPATKQGSSHGRSRIVRKAYPDPFYTEIMLDGYPLWWELDEHSGERILHECGLMYFGDPASPGVVSLIQGLQSLDVDHQIYGPASVKEVFPALHLETGEVGVFTPEAGWAHAERAVGAAIRLAIAAGATLTNLKIEPTQDPAKLLPDFDRVALCAGAWISRFIELPVEPTLQTFGYLDAEIDGPVWIEDSDDYLYGFPTEPGGYGAKIGVHTRGEVIDPDQPSREPDPEALAKIRDFGSRRFGIADPRTIEAAGCLYTNTADEDFRFGIVADRVVYASACSGHGFKFGPWSGRFVADLIEGTAAPTKYPRFAR